MCPYTRFQIYNGQVYDYQTYKTSSDPTGTAKRLESRQRMGMFFHVIRYEASVISNVVELRLLAL
jgi:hypothetical protein